MLGTLDLFLEPLTPNKERKLGGQDPGAKPLTVPACLECVRRNQTPAAELTKTSFFEKYIPVLEKVGSHPVTPEPQSFRKLVTLPLLDHFK